MANIRRRFPATARARPGARAPAAVPRDAPRVGLAALRAAPPAPPPPAGRHEISGPRRPQPGSQLGTPCCWLIEAGGGNRHRAYGGRGLARRGPRPHRRRSKVIAHSMGNHWSGAAPHALAGALSPDWAVGIVFGAPRVRPPAFRVFSSCPPCLKGGDPSGKLRDLGSPPPKGVAGGGGGRRQAWHWRAPGRCSGEPAGTTPAGLISLGRCTAGDRTSLGSWGMGIQ